jgi:hypothetical protein
VWVTVTVRGRRLLRPVAAVLLRLAEGRPRRTVARNLDALADQWNKRVPGLLAPRIRPVCGSAILTAP